jgi:hypothetical protein
MEPRLNVEKKPQMIHEELPWRQESRRKRRFSIEALEERIAPDHYKSTSGAGIPNNPNL